MCMTRTVKPDGTIVYTTAGHASCPNEGRPGPWPSASTVRVDVDEVRRVTRAVTKAILKTVVDGIVDEAVTRVRRLARVR